MSDPLSGARLEKLAGVHPTLADIARRIVIAMDALGYRMIVTDGVRTALEQRALFNKGRDHLGNVVNKNQVVTNADGAIKRSNHQPHADGLGHAVDMTFMDQHGTPLVLSDDTPSWDEKRFPFALYGSMGKSLGLTWGGDWASIHDLPHLELPDGILSTGASHAQV